MCWQRFTKFIQFLQTQQISKFSFFFNRIWWLWSSPLSATAYCILIWHVYRQWSTFFNNFFINSGRYDAREIWKHTFPAMTRQTDTSREQKRLNSLESTGDSKFTVAVLQGASSCNSSYNYTNSWVHLKLLWFLVQWLVGKWKLRLQLEIMCLIHYDCCCGFFMMFHERFSGCCELNVPVLLLKKHALCCFLLLHFFQVFQMCANDPRRHKQSVRGRQNPLKLLQLRSELPPNQTVHKSNLTINFKFVLYTAEATPCFSP